MSTRYEVQEQHLNPAVLNMDAYGYYVPLVNTGYQSIDVSIIKNKQDLDMHFTWILNILKDGIETKEVQSMKLFVQFVDGAKIHLSIFDYFFNLMFWYLPVGAGDPLTSNFLFYEEAITKNTIKKYIDDKFLDIHRTHFDNIQLNNMIDDVLYRFIYIDDFSFYLLNTLNNEDTIDLMESDPDFYNAIHCDLSNVPIEDVKSIGMDYTNRGINSIMKSGSHWGIPYFKSKEGINIKQFREAMFNIGTVPDGNGSVYPVVINNNFSNGGIGNPVFYSEEADKARQAQILNKQNVGESGAFARILGINNIDSRLNDDPEFVCNTKNFVSIYIANTQILNMYKNRYYRFKEDGFEYKLSSNPVRDNSDLIGKTLLFRSPITCASGAKGLGICYKCYGDLAYTNNDINIGRLASEESTSQLTQKQLSAKHLLETKIKKIDWPTSFKKYFEISGDVIKLQDSLPYNLKKSYIAINTELISIEDEVDECITGFDVINSKGEKDSIYVDDIDNYYFTDMMIQIMKKYKPDDDGILYINLDALTDMGIFFIKLTNDELGKSLAKFKSILNTKTQVQRLQTASAITQAMVETVIEGGMTIDAIHLEVMLSNQCVSVDDCLQKPEWEYPNAPYRMVATSDALKNNPSVTISLLYQNVKKNLYYPLTFKKNKASSVDLFFMTQPQNYMDMEPVESDIKSDKDVIKKPFEIMEDDYIDTEEDDSDSMMDE